MIAWIFPHTLGIPAFVSVSPIELIREIAFPLMLIWVLTAPLVLPQRLLWWCAVLFTPTCAILALSGPPVYAGQVGARLASITSGFDNFHASAKVVALQLLLVDQLRRAQLMRPQIAWPLILLCAGIMYGYAGRNEMLIVITYYCTLIYFRLRNDLLIRFLPAMIAVVAILSGTIILMIVDHPGSLGSGRIGVWSYRLWLLSQRDIITSLFGTGVGTDYIWTPQWWYFEGSVAHNDYIHQTMEEELVGLASMGVFFVGLWMRLSDDGRALLVGVAVNSIFANGFFQSPLLALSLTLVFAMSLLGTNVRQTNAAVAQRIHILPTVHPDQYQKS